MTGVILAGGASSRMGSNKALLPHRNGRIIEGIYRTLAALFKEVIVVTNTPEHYPFLPCRKVPDIYPGCGVVSGVHAGLRHSNDSAVFVVGCDMPLLQGELIQYMTALSEGVDVVIPVSPGGFEPLHAVYGKGCIPVLEEQIVNGNQRIRSLLPRVRVREVHPDEIALFDQGGDCFTNINTPEDYFRLRSGDKAPRKPLTAKFYQSL